MSRPIIHLGANKTGSTTLQRCLFSQSSRFQYLGEDCRGYAEYKSVLDSLVSDDDVHFDFPATKQLFARVRNEFPERRFIYSNEDVMASRLPSLCARRLHTLIPDADIFVVIRNQLSAIPSWYASHGAFLKSVPRRYWRRYVSFDDWMSHCFAFLNYSPLDSYFYHRILSLYASLYGKERIHILMYERWSEQEQFFLEQLGSILEMGADEIHTLLNNKRERPRLTKRMFLCHRRFGWYLQGRMLSEVLPGQWLRRWCQRYLKNSPPVGGFMTPEWRQHIVDLYREDNRKLADDYQLPLRDYDYPL